MRNLFILLSVLGLTSARAQLINGSFEDALGNFSDSAWVSTCTVMPGPAAPGHGDSGILVPHSNAPGCGWSRLYQFVPAIGDGETWTLSGWCANFTWIFANPYSGFRFGVKDALGNLSFNTAALQNTGNWTFLSVTNTFSLAPGDTVFVECDPGTVSGLGMNLVFAMFDGVELSSLPTGVSDAEPMMRVHVRPNPALDRVWLATDEPVLELRIIGADGATQRMVPYQMNGATTELDVTSLPSGLHLLWVRTAGGNHTTRFIRL